MATQTITWFAETTGFTRETVKKRLDAAGLVPVPGARNAALYETPSALAAIYQQPAKAKRKGESGEVLQYLIEQSVDIATLLDPETNRAYHLAEIHAAPNWLWPALVRQMEALENISAYDPADYAAEPAQPDR